MALQIQRLGLNAIRANLRTLSLSIRNEKTPVTEVSDPLPTIFITQFKKYPLNKDIQTTEDHYNERNKSFGHTVKNWPSSISGLEKRDEHGAQTEIVSEVDIFSSKQKIKPDCVSLYKQSLDDIFINDSFTHLETRHQNNRKEHSCENSLKHDRLSQTCAIDQINLELLTSSVSWCSDLTKPPSKQPSEKTPGKPSLEQLESIREALSEQLPKFFKRAFNYNLYDEKVIFENNIWNKKTIGIVKYGLQMMLVRMFASFKYVNVQMVLVKVTTHPKEGTVKVRWRIAGLTNSAAFKFWRYYPGRFKKNMKEDAQWTDGLSTFYVNGDGKIIKHRADKMIPDDELPNVNPVINEKIAPVGLMSKTELNNCIHSVL